MKRISLRQIANIIGLVATLVFNFVSQDTRLVENTNADIANRYPILYFPANAAFSIWGIIYTLLIAWVIYQALPSQRDNPNQQRIGWLFVVTCIANIAWLVSFQFLEQFALSMIAMLALLGTLIAIYLRLDIGRAAVSLRDRLLIHVPFSVYLGWITAATVTNATYVLYDAGYTQSFLGISAETWAVILFVVSALLALAAVITRRDVAYALVIVWALYFIGVRWQELETVGISAYVAAGVSLLAAAAGLAFMFIRNNNDQTGMRQRTA
ncbi:MAG: TspO/MBR family protein [bacterium]|nr:TspO/MBR family protein [bacterium]